MYLPEIVIHSTDEVLSGVRRNLDEHVAVVSTSLVSRTDKLGRPPLMVAHMCAVPIPNHRGGSFGEWQSDTSAFDDLTRLAPCDRSQPLAEYSQNPPGGWDHGPTSTVRVFTLSPLLVQQSSSTRRRMCDRRSLFASGQKTIVPDQLNKLVEQDPHEEPLSRHIEILSSFPTRRPTCRKKCPSVHRRGGGTAPWLRFAALISTLAAAGKARFHDLPTH